MTVVDCATGKFDTVTDWLSSIKTHKRFKRTGIYFTQTRNLHRFECIKSSYVVNTDVLDESSRLTSGI